MKREMQRVGDDELRKKGCCGTGLAELLEDVAAVFDSESSFDTVDAVFRAAVGKVPAEEWARFAHYDSAGYSRNLLAAKQSFSLILLCWEPGQMTPVHSHAPKAASEARRSWGHVIEGDLLMVEYSEEGQDCCGRQIVGAPVLYNSSNPSLRESTPRGHHVLQNLNKTRRAMSLHLYSPAFLDCCWQDKERNMQSVPVSYTPIGPDAIQSTYRLMGLNHSFFTSFDALAGIVTAELKRGDDVGRMIKIFESLRFNPKEFQRYAHWTAGKYTRNLVGFNNEFTLLMLCWDRGQESPIHDHCGSHCYMKLLEGELHEVRYDASDSSKLRLKGITQMTEESVAFIDDSQGVHKMVNPSIERGAISLHIYIPPYKKCSIFNLQLGTSKLVDMSAANSYNDKPFTPMELSASGDRAPITTVPLLIETLQTVFKAHQASDPAVRDGLIQATLDRVHFIQSEWTEYVHFSDHNYTRMLLTLNDEFSLMLICWNPNQSAPLHSHDHAPSNTMFVKTVLGGVHMRRYADSTGTAIVSERLLDPDVAALAISNKDIGWHMTHNMSLDQCALSLHLYTPPMLECVHAAGVAPVVYCDRSSSAPFSSSMASGGGASISSPMKHKGSKIHACASVFSNFQALMELLWAVFEKKDIADDAKLLKEELTATLTKIEFNPKEIEQYKSMNGAAYVRRRVALHPSFEVFLISWRAGTESPIHDHGGSSAMFKVLEGSVRDEHFSRPQRGMPPYIVQSNVLHRNDVAFHSPDLIHKMTVSDEADCCGLAIYLPSYDQFCTFCPKTGETSSITLE